VSGEALLFYLFAACALAGALGVVGLRNPIYGAIALLGTFLSVAALFLLRHAEFVAVVQVFVYGGGVMVLFLFVIMLVNIDRLRETRRFQPQWPVAAVVALALPALLALFLAGQRFGRGAGDPDNLRRVGARVLGNSEALAWTLYRDYLVPFELASLFLLVAMIGAVVLGGKRQ
jgi:NADH-quinone oxidoreductase subunit J